VDLLDGILLRYAFSAMQTEGYYRKIDRRVSRAIKVGDVTVGGGNPITVQTMTNFPTTDVQNVIKQINTCAEAGADLVRVSVPDKESCLALKEIVPNSPVPIIADVHFHYRRGIEAAMFGAKCVRINPGNVGNIDRARQIVKACSEYGCAIRIGVNGGSLEERLLEKYGAPCPEALVESAMDALKVLEDLDFFQTKVSVKASDVMLMVKSYRLLAQSCDYPLHLGVTEAGNKMVGSIKTAMAFGGLLMDGIGDTIRVSLSAPPEEEVYVGFEILKALSLRQRGITVISCPSCARQQFDVIAVVNEVERRTAGIREHIAVSILGCVVNGLGEAKYTDIGITGAGSGNHLIYLRGKPHSKCTSENLAETIVNLIEQMVAEKHNVVIAT
jgi:(E)-4-hydroxy-3-methylbut-2-enyl-diphosphate synthase